MERVEEVFTAVLDTAPEHRSDRLRCLCAQDSMLRTEVESLLKAADKAEGFLSAGPLPNSWPSALTAGEAHSADAMLGQQLGPWRIIRELDSGGMGVVFLAERIDGHYQQQVAIKLARQGLASAETTQRFQAERQILANLRHPNIAQLLDGGTGPDGQPYLVMEYVEGVAIDTWCDTQNLSIEDTLKLVVTVCEAVQYAHRNLIVHCDLKPSNILVSEGVPKLLDFGIATLLRPTVTCPSVSNLSLDYSRPLTPTFAAPEQIRGEPVTTATDIYALGVVLYRLLARQYPYSVNEISQSEMAQSVSDIEFPPPGSRVSGKRKSRIQGDLDNIVMKALQKDPQHRYSSLSALSADLQQYIAGYPVSVGANTWWDHSCKFASRHKGAVILAIVALVSLWIGSFISIWQWQSANDKHKLAEQRLADVRSMISTLVVDLPETMAAQPGSTRLRVQLLNQGIDRLDSLVKTQIDNPDLIRELAVAYTQLGRLQGNPSSINLGESARAAVTYEKSLSLRLELLKRYPDDMDLITDIAHNYASLSVINFAALGDSRLAYGYVGKCQKILEPRVTTGNSRVLRWLLACYALEAKWRSHDNNYQLARKALMAAENLAQAQKSDEVFWQSYDGYKLRARLHEEWAEIEANIGNKEKALNHEKRRLDITLAHLQDDKGQVGLYGPRRITGAAYRGYAARLAMTGDYSAAETALTEAEKSWTGVIEKYPADSSAMRSLHRIYAEFAEIHRQIAATHTDVLSKSRRAQQACDAYRESLRIARKMTINGEKIARRYSWSLELDTILQRYEAFCVNAGE